MGHFERDYWQVGLTFAHVATVPPEQLAAMLTRLPGLIPGADVQWQLPSLGASTPFQFQVEAGGVMSPLPPQFLVGNSPRGWRIQLSARQLIIQHQQVTEAGRRATSSADFPSRAEFSTAATNVLDALPAALIEAARRVQVTVSYAMFSDDYFPASIVREIIGQGARVKAPPPERERFVQMHQLTEFETIETRKCVWNEHSRVANWFAPDGRLYLGAGVVRSVDLRTAVPEVPASVSQGELPDVDDLPQLPVEELRRAFAHEGPFSLGTVLGRLRSSLPKGFEIDE